MLLFVDSINVLQVRVLPLVQLCICSDVEY